MHATVVTDQESVKAIVRQICGLCGGVFWNRCIRHDHKQYCLSRSDPANMDIERIVFRSNMFIPIFQNNEQ